MLQSQSVHDVRHRPRGSRPSALRTQVDTSPRATCASRAATHRVLFYSHDSFGLGHIRRTLSLCETVRGRYEHASLLVLTGSSAVSTLSVPEGVDWVKLPCVTKADDGQYRSRFLPIGFDAIRSVRRDIISSTAQAYRPSLVFVDNVPLGLGGELRQTLESIRKWSPGVRLVLTLRDILDEPARIISRWTREGTCAAIERLYDDVIIYGSREVFDVVREYQWPASLAAKVRYAGYIRREPQGPVGQTRTALLKGAERLVLVTVGGGGDGRALVDAYLQGLEGTGLGLGHGVHSLVVCGPEMALADRAAIRTRHGHRRDVTLIDASPDLVTTMAAADVVVAMGGYNTVCEVLSLQKHAVIMPRCRPRLEQWIRCSRMADLGLLSVVHPDHDPASRLMHEVRAALLAPPRGRAMLDLGGLSTLEDLLPTFLSTPCA